uniref:Retroviral envelope protein GP41-like domain-containing protein n=1 Tax=Moschus moschiferus TaxID=68415 RepID=A0A8C6CPF8_MOSMO
MGSVPVYVNDTVLLGGYSDKHISPHTANLSYNGISQQLPICFFRNYNVAGCLPITEAGYTDYANGWSLHIPGLTKAAGPTRRRNGTGPSDIPFCGLGAKGRYAAVPWRLCKNETATTYVIKDVNCTLWDWSQDSERNPGKEDNRQFVARIWNLGGSSVYQTELWKLAAATGLEGSFLQTGTNLKGRMFWNATWRFPHACVPHPFMLVIGAVNITKNQSMYSVACKNCILSNCVRGISKGTGVLVVRQPPFVMLPVNVTEAWYDEAGLEFWKRVEIALTRHRLGLGLVVFGITSLITLIASTITASLSLAQSVNTASFVDHLAKNTSLALGTQEDIDKKLEDKLNALYDAVRFLGEEVQGLKLRTKVKCHANYHWICVTSKEYNVSETPWDKVKVHLEGIWHNDNVSLDLVRLHQEILDIEETPNNEIDLAKRAETFVNNLFQHFPSINVFWRTAMSLLAIILLLAFALCILPCVIRRFIRELWGIKATLHSHYLQYKNQTYVLSKRKGGAAGSGPE